MSIMRRSSTLTGSRHGEVGWRVDEFSNTTCKEMAIELSRAPLASPSGELFLILNARVS
jgi:hypothetical protein